jgi:hypothetical protein
MESAERVSRTSALIGDHVGASSKRPVGGPEELRYGLTALHCAHGCLWGWTGHCFRLGRSLKTFLEYRESMSGMSSACQRGTSAVSA